MRGIMGHLYYQGRGQKWDSISLLLHPWNGLGACERFYITQIAHLLPSIPEDAIIKK